MPYDIEEIRKKLMASTPANPSKADMAALAEALEELRRIAKYHNLEIRSSRNTITALSLLVKQQENELAYLQVQINELKEAKATLDYPQLAQRFRKNRSN